MVATSLARSSLASAAVAPVRLTDHDVAGGTLREMLVRHSAPLSEVLTQELDGSAENVRSSAEEVLLAALGRTIGRTIGDGWAAVDLVGRRPMVLICASEKLVPATDMLVGVRSSLVAPGQSTGGGELAVTFSGPVADLPPVPHPIELRIYRSHGVLQLDWWYDLRRFYPYTVVELAEQFPLALIEVCSEATVPIWPEAQSSLICTAP